MMFERVRSFGDLMQVAALMRVVTMSHVLVASNVELELRCMALYIVCGRINEAAFLCSWVGGAYMHRRCSLYGPYHDARIIGL